VSRYDSSPKIARQLDCVVLCILYKIQIQQTECLKRGKMSSNLHSSKWSTHPNRAAAEITNERSFEANNSFLTVTPIGYATKEGTLYNIEQPGEGPDVHQSCSTTTQLTASKCRGEKRTRLVTLPSPPVYCSALFFRIHFYVRVRFCNSSSIMTFICKYLIRNLLTSAVEAFI
jgi:hypothetical protein